MKLKRIILLLLLTVMFSFFLMEKFFLRKMEVR